MIDDKPRPRRHPNLNHKRSLQAADVAVFVRQYGRKSQKGVEPNDRRYNQDVRRKIKHMSPIQLDALMREDED